uniref:Uncharacterized protein n=1 Tax=Globodera rostochiensis TaxID=31243 RepID=A0A914HJJ7_GLORO
MLFYSLFLPNLLLTLLVIASVAGTSPSKQKHASVSTHSMEISGTAPKHKNVPRIILNGRTLEIPEGSNPVHVLNSHMAAIRTAQLEKNTQKNREIKPSASGGRDEAFATAERDETSSTTRRDEATATARRARSRRARAQHGEDGDV